MSSNLPRKIIVIKAGLFDEKKTAREFDCFFTNVKRDLACKIPNASTSFRMLETKALSVNKLKVAFHSAKTSGPDYDDSNYNVIKKFFNSLCEPFKYLSIEKDFSPDDLKIIPVSLTYKGEERVKLVTIGQYLCFNAFPKSSSA